MRRAEKTPLATPAATSLAAAQSMETRDSVEDSGLESNGVPPEQVPTMLGASHTSERQPENRFSAVSVAHSPVVHSPPTSALENSQASGASNTSNAAPPNSALEANSVAAFPENTNLNTLMAAAKPSMTPSTMTPSATVTVGSPAGVAARWPDSEPSSSSRIASSPAISNFVLQIANVRPSSGKVKVAVFETADNFPNKQAAVETLELSDAASSVSTALVTRTACAIAVYQDINGDGELTRNRLGIPIEPCGFSNNAVIRRGPPKFAEAVVRPIGNGSPTVVRIELP